jgi:hypothetical protein
MPSIEAISEFFEMRSQSSVQYLQGMHAGQQGEPEEWEA